MLLQILQDRLDLPVKVETGLALDEEDRPLDRLCELYNRSCRTVRIDGEGLFLPLSSLRLRLDAHMILQDCGEEAGLLLLLLLSGFRIPAGTCCCGGNLRRMNGDPSGDPVSCTVLGFSDPAGLIKRLQRGLGTLGRSDAKDSSEEDPSRTATNLLTATPAQDRSIRIVKRQSLTFWLILILNFSRNQDRLGSNWQPWNDESGTDRVGCQDFQDRIQSGS